MRSLCARLNQPFGTRSSAVEQRDAQARFTSFLDRSEAPVIQIAARASPLRRKVVVVDGRFTCPMAASGLPRIPHRNNCAGLINYWLPLAHRIRRRKMRRGANHDHPGCRTASEPPLSANLPTRGGFRKWSAAAALGCMLCVVAALAQTPSSSEAQGAAPLQSLPQPQPSNQLQTKSVLKLKAPDAGVRLYGAHCRLICWLSALFAPAVFRDQVAAVPVINISSEPVILSAKFVPTNGLAMANAPALALDPVPLAASAKNMLTDPNATALIASGDTVQFKLERGSTPPLPAGLYTGQIQFQAKPATGNADPITQITTVEVRIRDSAIWALLTVVLGILLGRLSQLVYDPQVIARVQLLDWIHQIEPRIAGLPAGAGQPALKARLDDLRIRLFGRGVDAAALQADFRTLETDVNNAIAGAGGPATVAIAPPVPGPGAPTPLATGGWISRVLRILAGITPLPLETIYDRLLPLLVLLTLVALTVVFMLQQYGGTGTAETFGAGGLADYTGLFLAGVASEAIAGGLRAVKLR